jgi:hypothetical protein
MDRGTGSAAKAVVKLTQTNNSNRNTYRKLKLLVHGVVGFEALAVSRFF